MEIPEPKHGCEILCQIDISGKREDRMYEIKRPKMSPGWVITGESAFIAQVSDWHAVELFLKNVRASDIEISEF